MLTERQKNLLCKMVEVREDQDFGPFQFLRGEHGPILVYKHRPAIPVDADDGDFEELEARRLVTIERNEFGILTGRPTERGVRLVRSNFAEDVDTAEASPQLSAGSRRKRSLLEAQIKELERLEGLPLDHVETEEWERKTTAVLGVVFGSTRRWDSEFSSLRQMEEAGAPYTHMQGWESETRGKRLRDRQGALLRTALFELENLLTEPSEPEGYALHPRIEKVSGKVFRDGHFREAAFNAYVAVIEAVKTRTGLLDKKGKPMDGEPLMRQAFDCENNKTPPVRFNDLKTESERDEQQGFMHLFLGLVRLRHSKAHSVRPFDDPSRAHEYLCLASLLMRLLDAAIVTRPAAESDEGEG